jgi:hypothetical protein
MLGLYFEAEESCIEDLEVIDELINYKTHVFYHLLARGRAKVKLGDVDAYEMHLWSL